MAGQGLHGGELASVRFVPRPGPAVVRCGASEAPLDSLRVVATERSTTVASEDGAIRIATVEHLFAALAACGVRRDVVIAIAGPELPLADGGARAFVDAIASLDIAPSPPRLRVAREGTIAVGSSVYELTPWEGVSIEVAIDFGDARLAPRASWDGDREDFRTRIAIARTFGFARELGELLERGLASHVAPESVVVVCEDRILAAGRAFEADEPARHKLLDLVGDMYVHGGPPRGRVKATRPGHAATHEAMARARDQGLVVTA